MIRVISLFCKLNSLKFSDLSIFNKSIDSLLNNPIVCPSCGADNLYPNYSSYERTMISFDENGRKEIIVSIPRCKCSCGKTHALIPDILIPFSSYSLRFILITLWKFMCRKTSVEVFCYEHCIAVSTIYKWIHLFRLHYNLLVGAINEISKLSTDAITYIVSTQNLTGSFFNRFHFSFLQNRGITTDCNHMPDPPDF
jgi:hypothetical protein